MGSPTQTSGGAICIQVSQQDHLAIAGTEDNGVRTATEMFIIRWNGPATAVDCEGCTDGTNTAPVRGTPHPSDTSRAASRIEIRPAENNSRLIFNQRTEYTDQLDSVTNPLLAPPVIEWDFGTGDEKPYFLDNDPAGQKPSVNTAGQRFQEFLQRSQGTVTASFQLNIPLTGSGSWDPSVALNYCAGGTNQSTPAINSDSFTIDGKTISIGQARAVSCTCSGQQISNGVKFRVKKWTLAFRSSWTDFVENRGFEALVTVAGPTNQLLPINKGLPPGSPPTQPWPLFTSGHAMPNCTDVPPLLSFYPYRQLAFSTLGFT